jgi:hypothetical protein
MPFWNSDILSENLVENEFYLFGQKVLNCLVILTTLRSEFIPESLSIGGFVSPLPSPSALQAVRLLAALSGKIIYRCLDCGDLRKGFVGVKCKDLRPRIFPGLFCK